MLSLYISNVPNICYKKVLGFFAHFLLGTSRLHSVQTFRHQSNRKTAHFSDSQLNLRLLLLRISFFAFVVLWSFTFLSLQSLIKIKHSCPCITKKQLCILCYFSKCHFSINALLYLDNNENFKCTLYISIQLFSVHFNLISDSMYISD